MDLSSWAGSNLLVWSTRPCSSRWLLVGLGAAWFVGFPGSPGGLSGQAAKSDRATVVHVLNRMTFGPRETDVQRVSRIGVEAYFNEQLHPEKLDDSAMEATLQEFETLRMTTAELSDKYFEPARAAQRQRQAQAGRTPAPGGANDTMAGSTPMTPQATGPPEAGPVSPEAERALAAQRTVVNELMQAKMLRAALSERQLEEVLTDFWFNHFNVFVGKGQVRAVPDRVRARRRSGRTCSATSATLLGAVAHSPAMLFYLDNFQSATPERRRRLSARARTTTRATPRWRPSSGAGSWSGMRQMQPLSQQRPSARGLNENYARELMELHTLGVDGGYTQKDVIELARILTGWTIDRPQQGGEFVFRPADARHGTKTLLGMTFASAGESEGERALDLLANHPSTARHISYQARAAIRRRRAAGRRSWTGRRRSFTTTKGDLREVVRDDRHVAGVLRRRAPPREGQDAARVRRLGRAGDGRDVVNAQPLVDGHAESRHAALRLPAADRLQHDGRRLGEHRRAAEPHELRRATRRRRARGATADRTVGALPPHGGRGAAPGTTRTRPGGRPDAERLARGPVRSTSRDSRQTRRASSRAA